MPVPPTSDLLATISMFEQQIKSEPMSFYSACPPPPQMAQQMQARADNTTQQPQPQQHSQHQQQPQQQQQQPQHQQQSVIAMIDNKSNVIHPQILIVRTIEIVFRKKGLNSNFNFCFHPISRIIQLACKIGGQGFQRMTKQAMR